MNAAIRYLIEELDCLPDSAALKELFDVVQDYAITLDAGETMLMVATRSMLRPPIFAALPDDKDGPERALAFQAALLSMSDQLDYDRIRVIYKYAASQRFDLYDSNMLISSLRVLDERAIEAIRPELDDLLVQWPPRQADDCIRMLRRSFPELRMEFGQPCEFCWRY